MHQRRSLMRFKLLCKLFCLPYYELRCSNSVSSALQCRDRHVHCCNASSAAQQLSAAHLSAMSCQKVIVQSCKTLDA
jgi:hypothetical protein